MTRAVRPPFRVRVPGSTSNLGPGFDLLGLALEMNLHLEVRATRRDRIARGGTLGDLAVSREDDLVVRAMRLLFESRGERLPPLDLAVRSEIPVARGLGSSGAAVAAGLVAANVLLGGPLRPLDLCAAGARLEGHPENVAASLLGGLVAGNAGPAGEWAFLRLPFDARLRVAVAWPDRRVPTEAARAALPSTVPFETARDNARNLAFLLEGLRRLDARLLALGVRDGLHVPYRRPLVPGYDRVVEAARSKGALVATISGSGSAVIALCDGDAPAERAARAMARAFRDCGSLAWQRVLRVPGRGPLVRRLRR